MNYSLSDPVIQKVLSQLGPRQREYFESALKNPSFKFYKEAALYKLAQKTLNLRSRLLNGGFSDIKNIFIELGNTSEYGFGEDLLPVLEDLVATHEEIKDPLISQELIQTCVEFMVNHPKLYSKDLLEFALNKGVLSFFSRSLWSHSYFGKAYYLATSRYDGGEWGRQFVPVIRKNQELLGTKPINIAGSEVAQTVEHWLQDYTGFIRKPDGLREPLDRLNFINKAPNVKLLSADEKTLLLKLLEVFDWFCDPYVTKEVVEYFEGPQDDVSEEDFKPEDNVEMSTQNQPVSSSVYPTLEQQPNQSALSVDIKTEPVASSKVSPPPPVQNLKQPPAKLQQKKPKVQKFTLPDLTEKELPEPEEGLLLEGPSPKQPSSPEPKPTSPKISEASQSPATQTFSREPDSSKTFKPVPPKGVSLPKLAKPLELGSKPARNPGVVLPDPLPDLANLKQQAQKKKTQIEEDIDTKLQNLNQDIDQ